MEFDEIIPEITVVMPVYNSEEFLPEAISSILNQSYTNFEFLIVYDESNDNSLKILNKYSKLDPRVRVIKGNKSGISGALNKGLQESKGRFVARMDADDISNIDRLETQLKYLKDNSLDICGSHHTIINKLGDEIGLFVAPITHESCTLALAFEVPFVHPSVMIRNLFFSRNNLLYGQSKYKNAEDYDLWTRMQEAGAKFGNIDVSLLKYRVLENSLSGLNSKMVLKDTKALSHKSFSKNYYQNLKNIEFIINKANSKEQLLVARFLIISLFKFRFNKINLITKISLKIIIYAILSEMLKRIRSLFNKIPELK